MSESIRDICAYIFRNYPNPSQLSKPRLVKLLYLLDWKYTLDYGHQATKITWFYNHYGPYVDDVIDVLKQYPDYFKIDSFDNPYTHGRSERVKLISKKTPEINPKIKEILDLLIEYTSDMSWEQFISLVYQTYPIRKQAKYSDLNLQELAKSYVSHKDRKEKQLSN